MRNSYAKRAIFPLTDLTKRPAAGPQNITVKVKFSFQRLFSDLFAFSTAEQTHKERRDKKNSKRGLEKFSDDIETFG